MPGMSICGTMRISVAQGGKHDIDVFRVGIGCDAVAKVEDMRPPSKGIADLSGCINQGLTTVHQSVREAGRWAARVLLDAIGDPATEPETRLENPELIVRASTVAET